MHSCITFASLFRVSIPQRMNKLRRENGGSDIPEGLCWHVLDGISQALLWLHHGHKHTFPFNHHMEHDDDWHPILFTDITPANSKSRVVLTTG